MRPPSRRRAVLESPKGLTDREGDQPQGGMMKGFFATTSVQGIPGLNGGVVFGGPCSCITEVAFATAPTSRGTAGLFSKAASLWRLAGTGL